MTDNLFDLPLPLTLPPLFTGEAVSGSTDPFTKACTRATLGCDSGLLVHNISLDRLRAAIVFVPEMPLEQAMAVSVACGVGFQNALGALAPPEVAVHLSWQGGIAINGGHAGRIRVAAAQTDPTQVPDWLVVGLELQLLPKSDLAAGDTPDETSLFQEGCGEVAPIRLLESWSRHTLVWVNRLTEDGPAALHTEWQGLVPGIGEPTTSQIKGKIISGNFMGVDENFGKLIRDSEQTYILPLSSQLENG